MAQLRIGCVVMAAGNARRFGENKLAVQVQGKALFHRALEAVPADQFVRTVVVSQYPEVLELAHRMGFVPVPNRHPDWGISHTISLGLGKLPEMDAALFQVADQPLLRRETVEAMTALFCREQPSPTEWQKETEREIFRLGAVAENDPAPLVGSPVLFGSSFFPELLTLPENKGGNILLKKYPAQVRTVCIADSAELLDADTPEVLQQLEALARQKS